MKVMQMAGITTKLLTSSLLMGFFISSTTLQAAEQVLNVYNWTDYFSETTIEDFEYETGIKVNLSTYGSGEVLEARMHAGGSNFDVVFPGNTSLERSLRTDLKVYKELDLSKLPNYINLDPEALQLLTSSDPENKHAIPYMWGTTGYGYDARQIKRIVGADAPTDSWELIFNPVYAEKIAECGLSMLDSPNEVIEAALNYAGHDPHSENRDDYKDAQAALMAIRPFIAYFTSEVYVYEMASGKVCTAQGWSGDIALAAWDAEEGIDIRYTVPKEGTALWYDTVAIPYDAPNPNNAHKFLNFLMRPDVIADISNYIWYANSNIPSNEFIDEDLRNDPSVYPPADVAEKLWLDRLVPESVERMRLRLWKKVKTGSN